MATERTGQGSTGGCCGPGPGGVIDREAAQRLAGVAKALSDPTRVRLMSLIAAGEGGEACICDLTDPVGLSQPTVSHHMKLLADAGLVRREQRGRWAYFRVVDEAVTALGESLAALAPGSPVSARADRRSLPTLR